VERYSKLNRAERSASVAADSRHRFQNVLPNLVSDWLQLFQGQST
jgi:hypothetical protein